jgi:hypothetical protein
LGSERGNEVNNLPLSLSILLITAFSCLDKVPFSDNYGYFSTAAAHWFENEGVAYVFFRLSEAPERLPGAQYEMSYQWKNSTGGIESTKLEIVDFTAGIHQHHLQACGSHEICGSYSWKVAGPLQSIKFRMRYSDKSEMGLEAYINISNHDATETAFAFSQIPYGIFDAANERFQVRLENNFGTPASAEVRQYGMIRNNRFSNPRLHGEAWTVIKEKIDKVGYAFPLESCGTVSGTNADSVTSHTEETWLPGDFTPANDSVGLCYDTDFLDKNSEVLVSAVGFGLRNPVLKSDGDLVVRTPLTRTISIPVVINVCDDDEYSADLISRDFLAYQEYILGFPGRVTDVCFSVKNPSAFTKQLEDHLAQRLTEQKQLATTPADFMFLVSFNEKLSAEFFHFHSTLAEALTKIAAADKDSISPRLVGSLVYGSTAAYKPSQAQIRYLLWCPQDLAREIFDPNNLLASPNCTTLKASSTNILGINFVAPMGPFPSLDNYVEYVKKYSDRGTAKSPNLVLNSVPSTNNTLTEKSAQVTYFESEQLTVNAGESVKICYDLDKNGILSSLRFRPQSLPNATSGLNILQVDALWRGEHPEGVYRIGIVWEVPFWGGVSYDTAISGTIASVIPFQKSFKQYEALGDRKWMTTSWNLGELLSQCQKYCDHPYFDEGGVYQLRNSWRTASSDSCFQPLIPQWHPEVGA